MEEEYRFGEVKIHVSRVAKVVIMLFQACRTCSSALPYDDCFQVTSAMSVAPPTVQPSMQSMRFLARSEGDAIQDPRS